MKHIIASTFLLIPLCCNAQEFVKKFYDKNGTVVSEMESEYYSVEKGVFKSPFDTLKTFFTGGNTLRSHSIVNDAGIRDGATIYYHKNGKVKFTANYRKGSLSGDVISYYPEGSMQSIENFNDQIFNKNTLLSYWDSLGNQIIKDGTGFCRCVLGIARGHKNIETGKMIDGYKDSVWVSFDDSGNKYYEEAYNKGEFIKGISFDTDGNQYEYTVIEASAEYPGGMQALYEHVGTMMRYPKEARKKGIEGRVFVEFVIEKDGTVSNIKVIKGIGGGCDEVARDAIHSLHKWKPGTQRGKPVKQKMVLPLTFKLR